MDLPSDAMELLYGSRASEIYEYLQDLDPELNQLIQRHAYDAFWLRPGLTTREKSMVTLSALVAMRVQSPLRLHMIGFLSCGGTIEELRNVLLHLVPYVGFPPVLGAFSVLRTVEEELQRPESGSTP